MSLMPDLDKAFQDKLAERRMALKSRISTSTGDERKAAEEELAELDRLVELALEQHSHSAAEKLDEMLH